MKLRSEIRSRFKYLSKVASLHFLMDIGITVLKPDIVIRRIFDRLGLIESESEDEQNLIESVRVGHKFAQATGHPIRYIDIFFVSYGQMNSTGTGLAQAICVTDNPRCGICGVTDYCQYFRETAKAHAVASHDAYADARVLPGAAWKTIAEKLRKPRAPARG